jgi:hypothetical protein
MDNNEEELSSFAYRFVTLDLPQILKPPHLRVNIMPAWVPKFDGNTLLAADFLEFFMNYITTVNFVFEDELMIVLPSKLH